jgi:hypothetical protein
MGETYVFLCVSFYNKIIIRVGSGSFAGNAASAISDTGTSFIFGPTNDVGRIMDQIGAQYDPSMQLVSVYL